MLSDLPEVSQPSAASAGKPPDSCGEVIRVLKDERGCRSMILIFLSTPCTLV